MITKNNNLTYLKIAFISMISIGIITFIISIKQEKEPKKEKDKEKELDLTKLDPNIDKIKLKEDIFNIYKDFQTARTKNKIVLLEKVLTNNLLPKYKEELKKLKENKEKLVITNILKKELKILSIEEKDNEKYLKVYLYVTEYDYKLDKNKKVIKGTDDSKYHAEFNITFKYLKDNLKIEKIDCTGKWIGK